MQKTEERKWIESIIKAETLEMQYRIHQLESQISLLQIALLSLRKEQQVKTETTASHPISFPTSGVHNIK